MVAYWMWIIWSQLFVNLCLMCEVKYRWYPVLWVMTDVIHQWMAGMASQAHIHFSHFSGKHRSGNDYECPALSCYQLQPYSASSHVFWTIYAEQQQKSYWELSVTMTDFNTKIQHFEDSFPNTHHHNGLKKTYLNMLFLSVIKLN